MPDLEVLLSAAVVLVINATGPKTCPGGSFGLPCALIIKRFSEGERHNKAALNDVLRAPMARRFESACTTSLSAAHQCSDVQCR
jgi:hypothetical protein